MEQHPLPSPEASASKRMKDLPEEARPREAAQRYGVETLSNDMLLAILLGTGIKGKNVMQLAHEILESFDGLSGLVRANYDDILHANLGGERIQGIGPTKAIILAAAIELGRRFLTPVTGKRPQPLTSSARVAEMMFPITTRFNQEGLWVLHLDARRNLIGRPAQVTLGLLNQTHADVRSVFRRAIRLEAFGIILVHNHPTGDVDPSREDIRTTEKMLEASRILGVRLVDHIIIGVPGVEPEYLSMRQKGLCDFSES